ncbi:fibronectin type III domain-containing protein [Cellulosilyticum sp. I15G10I2]|uniref:fibronectin type III domain-containing protein n=1 Tax=Cellulosilyticum sp. I15G10I2 TaxID=1892843 RepID=UPI00085C9F89|nr:fibronectin type III domain-containing protein [Cellulosilyticum sp. I15G10I2]
MYKKKLVAWLLFIVLTISLVPINIFANAQTGSYSTTIANIIVRSNKNLSNATPDVTVQWNGVRNREIGTPNDPTQFYELLVTDALNNAAMRSPSSSIPATGDNSNEDAQSYIYNVGDTLKDNRFTSGKLYKIEIVPGHYHTNDSVTTPVRASNNQGVGYFFTDFNTRLENKNGQLEVNWEYIPGASYEVRYLPADRATVEQMEQGITNSSGVTITPTAVPISNAYAENASNQITVNGVKRVRYIVEQPTPGQIYSAYVVPTSVNNALIGNYRFENIVQNKETGINGPKVAQASTDILLDVFDVEPNYVRLEWHLASWITANSKLKKTEIYKIDEGNAVPQLIGTILNTSLAENKDLGYYQYLRPTKNTTFFVRFQIDEMSEMLETERVLYIPGQAAVRPLKPKIPEPFSESIDISDTNIDIRPYIVSEDDISRGSLQFKDNTFHVTNTNPLNIQLVWDAPTKTDTLNNKIVDYDIQYDVYVTKDKNLLEDENLTPIASNLPFYELAPNNLIFNQSRTRVVGFKTLIEQYTKADNTQAALNANSSYFIKVIAKRPYGTSYILSDPTIVSITIDKNGEVFTPPILAKPPLKLHETTMVSATLRWRTTWREIYVKDATLRDNYPPEEKQQALQWNSVVYTGTATPPYIRFKPAEGLTEHILNTSNQVDQIRNSVGTVYYDDHYINRTVALGDESNYEFKVLSYDEVNRQIAKYIEEKGMQMTIQDWLMDPVNFGQTGWETIAPHIPQTNQEPDNNNWMEYTKEGLLPNTRYVLLIRAYKVLDDGTRLVQTYPSYVLATTLTDYESPEETPKTPELNLDTKDDTSITVWWMYNNSFDYEIVYSRLDNPSAAITWDFNISDVPGDMNYVSNGAKANVRITGLVPETTYNVWIRAKQKKGTETSAWSNPVTVKTDPLGTPAMPTGLGPAAYQSILEIGQDFPPIAKDYITVEWIKNANDTAEMQNTEKQYSYVVEFADNPEFLDAVIVNTSGAVVPGNNGDAQYEVLAKNMVRFNNLIANRPYYVKVKTVLTYKDTEGNREIVRESDYTSWVRILTKTSTDEYDGGENDNIITYPEAIIEDYSKDIWTVEIVDTAKIITDIMKKKDYFYTIKVEKFNNKHDAAIRRLKIPKSIIDALISQRMELKIATNIGIYEIPVKALEVYTKQHSAKDMVQLEFTQIVDYKITHIIRQYPETLLKGEQLDIFIKGSNRTTIIKKLDGYLKVKLKLDAAKEYMYKDLFAYTYNFDAAAWKKENHSIDTLTDTYITYSTAVTGIYTVYEKLKTASAYSSTYGMRLLANTYGISALGTVYFQNEVVHSNQFVHLLLGIAQNKPQIDLTAPVYADTLTKARTAGIYTESASGGINEEQAIAAVVRLYELKTGYKVKPSNVAISGVSSKYQEAVKKAYAIGLIDTINPKQPVRYALLCDWLLQVTE